MNPISTTTAILGLGHVGLPMARLALSQGGCVIGVDPLEHARRSAEESLSSFLDANGLRRFTVSDSLPKQVTNIEQILICVPTPTKLSGAPELSFVWKASEMVADYISVTDSKPLVILESTTYPGSTRTDVAKVIERLTGKLCGKDFFVAYSPERIDPGSDVDLEKIPKLVAGIDEISLEMAKNFYSSVFDTVIEMSSLENAEMAKLIENTYRFVNISFVNELAAQARHLGVDIYESIDAASSKPFGFQKFTPGPGIGGHCIPEDPYYLDWAIREKTGAGLEIISAGTSIEESVRAKLVNEVSKLSILHSEPGAIPSICLLGLSYKKGTGDIRNAASISLINALHQKVRFAAFDPYVSKEAWPKEVERMEMEDVGSALEMANLSVVLTPHEEVMTIDFTQFFTTTLDTTGLLPMGPKILRFF